MSDVTTPEPHPSGKRPDRLRLFEVASEQGGYFTAHQARACGYSFTLLSHHVKSGRFIRVRRGLYRLREYPSSPREEVLAAWLAVGKDIAVVSHESALDILDLSDVIPDAAHLTVPRSRRNLPSLPGVKIHTTVRPLRPSDLTYHDGMVVTSATRTILDAAEAGMAPEQVELAVVQAVERGLAAPDQLRRDAAPRGRRVAALIEGALRRAAA
ncbi:MAG: type IV toxin-antitoxin system AbiEi family antitoxin domain-containing protein [Dehalococcoidales bacterium]|nr:type IV toxin-antitoxin system AbiEi family antitoxin domain-containing protein [Dehalococcoidales bacterium]